MSTAHRPRTRWLPLLVALALVAAGCSPGPTSTPPPTAAGPPSGPITWSGTPDEKSPTWAADLDPDSAYGLHRRKGLATVVRPELVPLAAADTSALTSVDIVNRAECLSDAAQHPMCRFRLVFSALPARVTVGAVLNAGVTPATPDGLLVKVTHISGTSVDAVQATLQDALVQGRVLGREGTQRQRSCAPPRRSPTGVVLTAPSATPKSTPTGTPATAGNARRRTSTHPGFDVIGIPGELRIDAEPVDGVHLSGTLDFGAGCGLDGGVGGSDIAWVEVSCKAWQEASLAVTSTGSGPRHTERFFIADIPLAAIPIPIGPIVVVVVVDILITADINGQVHVNLRYGGTERAEVTGSVRYSIGNGLDHDGSVKVSAWSADSGLAADVEATTLARAQLRLSAYGVLGFYVGGDASLVFSGGPARSPRWQLKGNAGVFAGIFLGILGFELRAEIAYHLKAPFLIATGSNSTALDHRDVADRRARRSPPADCCHLPSKLTAIDAEDGALPVTWEDQTDHTTVTGSGPLRLPLASIGTHLLDVSATDSEGARTTTAVTVTVSAPSLTMTLTARDSSLAALSGTPSMPSGTVVFVDAALQTNAITPPSCSGITWRATGATVTTDGSCRATVTLTQIGTARVTASAQDTWGTSANATVAWTVTTAPPTVTPQFAGIDARAGTRIVTSGTRPGGQRTGHPHPDLPQSRCCWARRDLLLDPDDRRDHDPCDRRDRRDGRTGGTRRCAPTLRPHRGGTRRPSPSWPRTPSAGRP
ncbi:MAG: hypothetical protein V9F04_08485 [Dermatophilaceae bacterium]